MWFFISWSLHLMKPWKIEIFWQCFLVVPYEYQKHEQNIHQFETYLDLLKHRFTVIGLTETWLKDSHCDLYGIKCYHLIEKHRKSQGGGVAVCIKDHLNYFERPDVSLFESDLESVFIEIDKKQLGLNKNVIVGIIYRPPGADIKYFNDKMSILLMMISVPLFLS